MTVHPTAIIAPGAKLHETVQVGPYATIGPNVEIGKNTVVGAHAHIEGNTTIGPDNLLSPFVSIGCPPQDLKYAGEKTFVKIGKGNHFREFTTVHMGEGEGTCTTIGDFNLLMAYVHIAHNCEIGSHIIMSNLTTLAGHVKIGDRAVLGGFTGVHQFCQVGSLVMIGGMTKVTKDVPPYIKLDGNPARVIGLNAVGLKRNGVPRESMDNIRNLFRLFFRTPMNVSQVKGRWRQELDENDPYVQDFFRFIDGSKRGVYKRTRDSRPDRDQD